MIKNEIQSINEINLIDKNDLTDIKDMRIDPDASYIDRLISFMDQTKNLFCFVCEGVAVRVNYATDGKSLEETLAEHFSKFKA